MKQSACGNESNKENACGNDPNKESTSGKAPAATTQTKKAPAATTQTKKALAATTQTMKPTQQNTIGPRPLPPILIFIGASGAHHSVQEACRTSHSFRKLVLGVTSMSLGLDDTSHASESLLSFAGV